PQPPILPDGGGDGGREGAGIETTADVVQKDHAGHLEQLRGDALSPLVVIASFRHGRQPPPRRGKRQDIRKQRLSRPRHCGLDEVERRASLEETAGEWQEECGQRMRPLRGTNEWKFAQQVLGQGLCRAKNLVLRRVPRYRRDREAAHWRIVVSAVAL